MKFIKSILMKKIILLILASTSLSFAQLSASDFDKQMKLSLGDDLKMSLSNLEILEKKFPTDAKVMFLRGFYQLRDGDKNGAMMNLSKAIKSDPKFALSFGGRAQLFAMKGMLDKAIIDISEAIKLEPKNIDFLTKRSGYLYDNKQYLEGLADCKTLIQLNPTNIIGYYDAANFSQLANLASSSESYFAKAYTVKGMQKYAVDFFYAKYLLKHNQFVEAKPLIELALAVGEKNFEADDLNLAGIIFYKNKDLDKAEQLLLKSISLNSDKAEVFNNLASVYMDQEKWQKVAETASLALKADENNAMANMYMAIGMKKTGNEEMSKFYQEKAKKLEAEQNK